MCLARCSGALKTMNFALSTTNFAIKMMNFRAAPFVAMWLVTASSGAVADRLVSFYTLPCCFHTFFLCVFCTVFVLKTMNFRLGAAWLAGGSG